MSGIVLGPQGNPVPETQVDAEWKTGNASAVADEQGRFSLPVPKNTYGDGDLIFFRKARIKPISENGWWVIEEDIFDISFYGDVYGDQLTRYLYVKYENFPVVGDRSGIGKGPLGTWDAVTTYNTMDFPGQIRLQRDEDGAISGTWVDGIGHPELSRLLVPETITISADSEGFKAYSEVFEVPFEGRNDIALTLIETASVSGQVVDSNGKPMSGWRVSAYLTDGNRTAISQVNTLTDDSGLFSIPDLKPGPYAVIMYSPSTIQQSTPELMINLAPGTAARDLKLVFELGRSLSSYILTANGDPIKEATIRVNSMYTNKSTPRSDSSGFFPFQISGRTVQRKAICGWCIQTISSSIVHSL